MITFYIRSGSNQNDASTYTIVKLYFEQPNEQPNTQPNEQPDEHIITKLNSLFNYFIYNTTTSEKITSEDRDIIIKILERLDIYITNPKILEYFNEQQKYDYKLKYWAIKEIYFSPDKAFLYNLTRKQFEFRFLKAKKYMDIKKCSIYEFLAYFIKCLKNEMQKGAKINDRKL